MRALVTGSAGFLGRHFVAELSARGWDVDGWDIKERRDALELFDRERRSGEFARYDLAVHAAALAPNRKAIDTRPGTLIYNQLLDASMFAWAQRVRPGRVLYFSSCAALDAEPDDYGQLKLTGERMAAQARRAGLPVTVVRPYSGYGEDQSADFPFGAFRDRALRYEDPFTIWGTGEQTRDWIHVDDVVNGALAVAESGTEDAVSLCTGVGTSMLQVAVKMAAEVDYVPTFDFIMNGHEGADVRVGDPTAMLRHYAPQVSLAEGVRRAIKGPQWT